MDDALPAALYLQRPSLEYAQAFDRFAASLKNPAEPTLAVLSSAIYAVELLKRCPGPVHLAGTGNFCAETFTACARDWAWGPLEALDLAGHGPSYTSILWAEPEADSIQQVAAQLRQRAGRGAHCWVVASGPLRTFLPAWKARPHPAQQPPAEQAVACGPLARVLLAQGWKVEGSTAFHGPRSILWSLFARAADRAGRPDWGDRCTHAMRSCYQEPGWLWPLAPLALIHARPA